MRPRVRAVHDPPRQVDHRRHHRPDRELAHEAAHEPDRAEEREQRRDAAEDELPHPDRLEVEQLVAQQARRRSDHDQLEDRPAQALHDVERRRQIGAAAAERRALEHHRRHTGVRADQRRHGEHPVPDHAAEERRRQRVAEREVEVRRQDEHQQRDAEVRPEQGRVERPEHAQALGHRLDSPPGRFFQDSLPSLVLTRSGSTGVISAPRGGAPRRPQATRSG
jgi:hypothetical protein